MPFLAKITEGWVRLAEDQAVAARVLADDLDVVTGLEAGMATEEVLEVHGEALRVSI